MFGSAVKKGSGGGGGAASGTRNFTNCSSTGKNGPLQSDCNTAYASDDLNSEVTVTNGIQEWTVPSNATYTIVAYGAQGGGPQGGLGAKISGQFTLNAGDVIKILVGQQGEKEDTYDRNASGGGGTFVTKSPHNDNNSILVIAGGGAGAFVDPGNQNHHGQTGTSGANGYSGTGGSSGAAASDPPSCAVASASGFSSNGYIGSCGTSNGVVAQSYTNGGVGGMSGYGYGSCYSTSGGFGGAGGAGRCMATTYACGGGGGYSGGGHMYAWSQNNISNAWAGGGGSYNNGSNTSNTAGNNSGHGKVTITW